MRLNPGGLIRMGLGSVDSLPNLATPQVHVEVHDLIMLPTNWFVHEQRTGGDAIKEGTRNIIAQTHISNQAYQNEFCWSLYLSTDKAYSITSEKTYSERIKKMINRKLIQWLPFLELIQQSKNIPWSKSMKLFENHKNPWILRPPNNLQNPRSPWNKTYS